MKKINAIGLSCPQPVLLAKKEIDANSNAIEIIVDNQTAVQNLKRLANSSGYDVKMIDNGTQHTLQLSKIGTIVEEVQEENRQTCSNTALFITEDTIGQGELGKNLMHMFLYTATQTMPIPKTILLMNKGVLLASENEQTIAHMSVLQENGCEILVCGACLDFYAVKEKLSVGIVSNMYEIYESMNIVDKVIKI